MTAIQKLVYPDFPTSEFLIRRINTMDLPNAVPGTEFHVYYLALQCNEYGVLFYKGPLDLSRHNFSMNEVEVWSRKRFEKEVRSEKMVLGDLSTFSLECHRAPTYLPVLTGQLLDLVEESKRENNLPNLFRLPEDEQEEQDLLEIEENMYGYAVPPNKVRQKSGHHVVYYGRFLTQQAVFYWNADKQIWEDTNQPGGWNPKTKTWDPNFRHTVPLLTPDRMKVQSVYASPFSFPEFTINDSGVVSLEPPVPSSE